MGECQLLLLPWKQWLHAALACPGVGWEAVGRGVPLRQVAVVMYGDCVRRAVANSTSASFAQLHQCTAP
jgi:hypothetical protein